MMPFPNIPFSSAKSAKVYSLEDITVAVKYKKTGSHKTPVFLCWPGIACCRDFVMDLFTILFVLHKLKIPVLRFSPV